MNGASALRFLLLGLIWGGSYTFIKVSLDGLTPSQLVLARLLLGLTFLLAFVAVRRVKLPPLGVTWGHIAVTSILGMVAPFLLLAWAETRTSAAMAGVIIAALPLVTLAAATAMLPAERATWRKTAGLLLGFAGVVLVISPWGSDPGSLLGQLAVLGAALCYAGQTVYLRKYLSMRGYSALALAASQLVLATVLQSVVTPFMPWRTPSLDSWSVALSIVILGVVCTGVAYVLYFRLIADLGATTASAVNYLVPVAAVVISTTTLGEPVTWNMLVGVVTVLVGLAIAENRLKQIGRFSSAGPAVPTGPAVEPQPAVEPRPQPAGSAEHRGD